MNCTTCGNFDRRLIVTIASDLLRNGSRRRRHECRHCGSRWTTWEGDRPRIGALPGVKRGKAGPYPPPLTDDEVRLVLEQTDISDEKMAKRLNRTRESVRQVRVGITYAKVHPDLSRRSPEGWQALSCASCIHWKFGCSFGVPDCEIEGVAFAKDCSLYEA